jgi:hypothetical protein
MSKHFLLFCITIIGCGTLCSQTSPQTGEAVPNSGAARSSIDSGEIGCGGVAVGPLTVDDVVAMLSKSTSSDVIFNISRQRGHLTFSPVELVTFKEKGAEDKLLEELAQGPEVYIGWSVLPSNVVRDNYGHYVLDKYFALDVAIANRSPDKSVIITALEFCHDELKDVSVDPTLVRGSLQKGELYGKRTTWSNTLQGVGSIMSPAAPFFKNALHRATFSTGAAMFSPMKSAFDLVFQDSIAVYLTNWDKDQVFKQGFIVPAGGSQRGRVFVPIEYIYPKPPNKNDKAAYAAWENATKGRFNVEEVKKVLGSLVVLGQEVQLTGRRRFSSQ